MVNETLQRRIYCPTCQCVTNQTIHDQDAGKATLKCLSCSNEWHFETYSVADIVMDRRRMMLEVKSK